MLRKWMLLSPLLLIAATSTQGGPRYNKAGELIAPTDYREWVFLSSGLNMNYGVNAQTATTISTMFLSIPFRGAPSRRPAIGPKEP